MYLLSPTSSLDGDQASGLGHFTLHRATQYYAEWGPERISTVHRGFFQ